MRSGRVRTYDRFLLPSIPTGNIHSLDCSWRRCDRKCMKTQHFWTVTGRGSEGKSFNVDTFTWRDFLSLPVVSLEQDVKGNFSDGA